jgi:DNA primase
MEKKRFSSDELYRLRNDIPVAVLIEHGLEIPSHRRHGRFCFLCPVCKEFNSAINMRTNQAKCFTCEKSFNTIDLVMETRQWDFVDSVRFLRKYYENLPQRTEQKDLMSEIPCKQPERFKKASRTPEHIGNILAGVMSSASSVTNTPSARNTDNQKSINPKSNELSNERILALERKVETLNRQIEEMVKLINPNPSL